MSIYTVYILATALLTCLTIVPVITRLSISIGLLDTPNDRKVHCQATPRLGGFAIFCSLLFTTIIFSDVDQKIRAILAGAIAIFLTGLADDLIGLTPRQKFMGEFLAAGLVIFMGDISVHHLGNPFNLNTIELGILSKPFTLIALVGLMNAFNLLDGLDGLAAGVCAISCVAFGILSFTSGNSSLLLLNITLLGSLIGFLRYNHHPAIIFMGDCGSLFLGYCMGVFSVFITTGGSKPVSPYIPLLVLGVPIIDTLVVMTRRKLSGNRLFSPDRTHFHHRLLDLGIKHRIAVLIIYGASYLLCSVAIIGRNWNDSALLGALLIVVAILYCALNFYESNNYSNRFKSLSDSFPYPTKYLRNIVHKTGILTVVIKYLLLAVLMLPILLSGKDIRLLALFPTVVLAISVIVYLTRYTWQSQILQGCIYVSSAFMIFIVENYGRDDLFLTVPLHHISHAIFFILLILVGFKILIRKRLSRLMVLPSEYLAMLIVLTIPLIPSEITAPLHLLTVAIKLIILFMGLKLVLMRQLKRNRKIMLVLVISSLVLVIRRVVEL